MRIDNRPIEMDRAAANRGVEGANPETAGRQSVEPAAAASRSDRVQISDAGRALAAQLEGPAGVREGLSPDRVAQIRKQILEGAYNSVEVAEQVARRMLERGDI